MSAQSANEKLEDGLRAKVRATLAKSLSDGLVQQIEQRLAQSFPTSTSYKSAYKSLTNLLKPKSDSLAPDTSLPAPVSTSKSLQTAIANPLAADVIGALENGKLSVGALINRVEQTEKAKRSTLHEAEAAAKQHVSYSEQLMQQESERVRRQRQVQEIVQLIIAAKEHVGQSGVKDPQAWVDVADRSMMLFYQHRPHLNYLYQALKAYARAEVLSSEYVQSHPGFLLKRSILHTILEDFNAAIKDLKSFATLPSSSNPASPSSSSASYSSIANHRIHVLASYVHTVSKLVSSKYHLSAEIIRRYQADLPHPTRQQVQHDCVLLPALNVGDNADKGIVLRVLGKVDQTSLYALQRNTHTDGSLLPLRGVNGGESIESPFKVPRSWIVMDASGNACCLTLFNTFGETSKQKSLKEGDILLLMQPIIKEINVEEQGKQGTYRSIQVLNPHSLAINYSQYNEADVVPFDE